MMITKALTATALVLALASCASQRNDPYDTGNLYGYPDAGYAETPDNPSLYDEPPAFDDSAADPGPSSTTHTVVRGDSLSKISRQYNVSMQAIIDANGIKNRNLLIVGQKLTIPSR